MAELPEAWSKVQRAAEEWLGLLGVLLAEVPEA